MKTKHIFFVVMLVLLASCNDYKVFEDEQYKNVFALISNSDNINSKVFSLDSTSATGYITLSMGGSNPITEDVTIQLVEDPSLIDTYNKNIYDQNVSKYAKRLPQSNYDIASHQCVIKAGQRGVIIPIVIRPAGLSPDSTYFIPIRVDSYNRYEMNPKKNYMLYRVYIKNKWAVGDGTTIYTLRGKRRALPSGNEISLPGTKIMAPISKNSVRVMAGNETYEASIPSLERAAMILTIADDRKVTITPMRDLQITQIDGDKEYPNTFIYENDGYNHYKTFLLHYRYTLDGNTYEMKEELRMQYNKDNEK
ncbi:BT_3044 domain-containing protein [Hoylesella saccharolytica]|uniref:BT_3044 domain-containing protein n=1 Tax=Hoylesella saccharolytica TaxID=633701 RepID=UPI0028E98A70|nr:DUF4361 domain-containing protein [Hoylesella saccharolytica]